MCFHISRDVRDFIGKPRAAHGVIQLILTPQSDGDHNWHVMNVVECGAWAMLGGAFLEALHWYNIRTKARFPTYARKLKYWIATLAIVAFGGVIAVLIMKLGGVMSGINAFTIGFMAPSFQTHLKKFMPKPTLGGQGMIAPEGFGDFFDW